jgi:uncharacterized protein
VKNLLLIFTRNPELGKVKTRLAASIGDKNALEIYQLLLNHTHHIALQVNMDCQVLYSEKVIQNDIWENDIFQKKIQVQGNLGVKMQQAFEDAFASGYQKVIIIGSDIIELESQDINQAIVKLDLNDVVIGPAIDGGYYLLGMKQMIPNIFINKKWGTNTVLKDTVNDLQNLKCEFLAQKNDIDTIDDLVGIPIFEKYLL